MRPAQSTAMPKLSEQHLHEFAQTEAEIAEGLAFMDELLASLNKQSGETGANQLLKKLLPSPYLLHHICPNLLKRAHLHRNQFALLSHVPHVLRRIETRSFVKHPNLSRLALAGEYLASILYGMEVECFHMLCLDKNGRLKENVLLNRGVYDASIFSLRLLLEELRRVGPDCIILCHNHPAGSVKPSQEDLECTSEALYALTSEGVPLLDHFIVCNQGAVSMRANEFIPEHFWLDQNRGHRLLENFLSNENLPDRMLNRTQPSYLFQSMDDEPQA